LRLGQGLVHRSFDGGFVDLVVVVVVVLGLVGGPVVILVVPSFVVDLVVVVSVVVFARVLGSLGVVALRGHGWCCCYSTGSLAPLASGGVRGRRHSRRSGLSLASRSSHVDTRTGSVVDKEARDAGPEGRSADGFAVRLEVFGCFGPVDLKGVESVLRYAGWGSSWIRKDRSNSRDDTYILAHN
jgi:hypothetical protein